MAHWLFKEEPSHFSYSNLERDGTAEWSGVHNALALRHLRSCKVGDTGFFYHTGSVRAIVGVFRVSRGPRRDPKDRRQSWSVEVRPVRPFRRPVTLAELRSDPALTELALLRITRLSIMPVDVGQWRRILGHEARGEAVAPK